MLQVVWFLYLKYNGISVLKKSPEVNIQLKFFLLFISCQMLHNKSPQNLEAYDSNSVLFLMGCARQEFRSNLAGWFWLEISPEDKQMSAWSVGIWRLDLGCRIHFQDGPLTWTHLNQMCNFHPSLLYSTATLLSLVNNYNVWKLNIQNRIEGMR